MYILSRRSSTHSNQAFDPNLHIHTHQSITHTITQQQISKTQGETHHPIPTLIHLISHNIHMYPLCLFKIPLPNGLRQLNHTLHRILFQQVLVVKMIEEDVEAFLCVVDLGFEGGRGFGFHALHVVGQDFVDGSCGGGDVCSVSGGWMV